MGGWHRRMLSVHVVRNSVLLHPRRQVLIRPASKVVIKFLQMMQVRSV